MGCTAKSAPVKRGRAPSPGRDVAAGAPARQPVLTRRISITKLSVEWQQSL
ncbi:hypothetical protein SAMN02745121_01579 [Nannocystis exedens]|uniref:Uncharacterized protein n=1 Tax=Nannocystis exedens TaxID=54 RepID=A0A1I1VDF6_9BACT|nr:hypothetical protein NAEX_05456 [Nannocystis exedens]SFD78490.1 hypothetical protein SAMN02745121_01579 [Nannocystis exedens]